MMVDVDRVEIARVFLEARFPARMAFIDHVGSLTDEFSDEYPNYEVLPTEVKLTRPEPQGPDSQLVLAPQRIWVNAPGEGQASALDAFENAITSVQKYLGLIRVDFVGARQHLLLPRSDVAVATSDFRSALFDYKTGAFEVLGDEPVEAQAIVAYRLSDGVCRLVATSVYTGEGRVEGVAPGALFLDVDRTDDRGTDVWEVLARGKELLTDGRGRALDFASRLNLVRDEPTQEEE